MSRLWSREEVAQLMEFAEVIAPSARRVLRLMSFIESLLPPPTEDLTTGDPEPIIDGSGVEQAGSSPGS